MAITGLRSAKFTAPSSFTDRGGRSMPTHCRQAQSPMINRRKRKATFYFIFRTRDRPRALRLASGPKRCAVRRTQGSSPYGIPLVRATPERVDFSLRHRHIHPCLPVLRAQYGGRVKPSAFPPRDLTRAYLLPAPPGQPATDCARCTAERSRGIRLNVKGLESSLPDMATGLTVLMIAAGLVLPLESVRDSH